MRINFLIFISLIFINLLLFYLESNFIRTDSKVFDFLAKDYPSSVVQNYMESQKNGGG